LKEYKEKSILVTGGAGFIGSHLVETLVNCGARVTALDNLSAGTWENLENVSRQVEIVEGDIRDASILETVIRKTTPQIVFHLAANASVPGSVDNPRYDFESNCLGTFLLLDALRQFSSITKFIMSSSAAVYGEPKHLPIMETTPLNPISPYGASKVSAETQCRIFYSAFRVPVVIGRIFNAYGPRMPRFVALDFLKKLKTNPASLEILGDGTQLRDFNFVNDVVKGLMLLGIKGAIGDAYNIASGKSISVDTLAQLLLKILKLGAATEIIHTHESWVGDAQAWKVEVAKIREIGYRPSVSLEEGLKIMVEWFESIYGKIRGN
jgi:UDP-glucose 4-epimerase